MVLGHIRGMELGQDGDFLYDIFNLVLGVFDINDLDGYRLAGPFIDPIGFSQYISTARLQPSYPL